MVEYHCFCFELIILKTLLKRVYNIQIIGEIKISDNQELTKEQQEAMDKAFERSMPEGLQKVHNEYSNIKKVYGIVSGKGGVGKSLVTSLLAVDAARKGMKTAILDGDITGPSIPKSFGVHQKTYGTDIGIMPAETRTGIKLMSINLLVDNEDKYSNEEINMVPNIE